ncbi:DNA polymerase III subunit beta [Polynucleobacter sp. JS-Safj-400b-B2]|uniref:DNA polymerase III subunit beta n=1 Tax=Polynucleobacter sp. JS-Safj-400b-B2 TaxID=2576921 RepID=UPI001C0B46D1|nr:DNA polymerase III subunit beta [Polynucleobacter sp. JS-Safj-400b-B2]MBU3625813.1 DNA polymerase III subunit beta [Polynucleobacter sp. JS-Safj-400b-B2]
MKVKTKLLVNALGMLAAIARNSTINPAGIVNLFASKGVLVLRSTNGVNYSSARVKVESDDLPLTGVSCGMLFHAVGSLVDDIVDLSLVGNKLVVKAGLSVFRLPISTVELASINRDFMVDSPIEFKTADFIKGLSRVAHAAAVKDIRYYLNGVNLDLADGAINFVATDGHRLSKYNLPTEGISQEGNFILPIDAVGFVMRNITSETFKLHLGSSAFTFESPDLVCQVMAIEGAFPDYKRVIPKHQDNFIIDGASLALDLDRVKTVAQKDPSVRITLEEGSAIVVSSGEADENEPLYTNSIALVKGKGGQFDSGFNADYLLDAISGIKANVQVKYGDLLSSIAIYDPEDPNFVEVLSPMRL